MDNELYLQYLREHTLEEDRVYIQEHVAELYDYAATGNVLADEALRLLYTPFVSLKIAEVLTFYGEYVGHSSSHALGLKAQGDALVQIGHYGAAIECLDAAGEQFLSLGDEGNWARSRISWITSKAWLGQVEEALQEAARAREAFMRPGEHYWVSAIDHNTAMIYMLTGHYLDALKLYEDMRVYYATLTERDDTFVRRDTALAELNQAITLSWLGDFKHAYQLLQQAHKSFSELEEVDLVINVEVDLAQIDFSQGYYGSALRRYYQARDTLLQSNVDDPLLLADLKLWIAGCLIKLDRAWDASLLSGEAVETYRQFGKSLNIGNVLRTHAETLVASGRKQEALATLDEASSILHEGGFEYHAVATRLQQAELLLETGEPVKAYDQAKQIKSSCEAQGLIVFAVRAGLVMAEALLRRGDGLSSPVDQQRQTLLLQEAALLCQQIKTQARQHNLQEAVYKSYYLLGRLWAARGNLAQATRNYKAAIAQIERILDDLAYDLSPAFLRTTWAVFEDMIALCLRQAQLERAFGYLEQARSMALRQYLNTSRTVQYKSSDAADTAVLASSPANGAMMWRMQQELKDWQEKYRDYSVLLAEFDASVSPAVKREILLSELKQCEVKISELFERLSLYQSGTTFKSGSGERVQSKTARLDLEQLRQHLAPDQLLLAYFLYGDKLVIFAVSAEGLVAQEIPGAVEQVERLLQFLHMRLDPGGWSDAYNPQQEIVRRLLHKLYDLLIKPVAGLLPPSGQITIVPYGRLHELPFHALYDGSHFLIEDFQVSYLPASSLLVHLHAVGAGLVPTRNGDVVNASLVAARSGSPLVLGYSENGHLQSVRDEARSIASLLGVTPYLEDEATIACLVEHAAGSPIIHLATHGQNRLDAPNFSYVRLADGQLNAIDAFSLDLRGCELVTLSGCETGLSLSGGGDEQLGLGRAFLAAGAISLLMSLWPVEDSGTSTLMQLFYQNLLKGETKAQALRLAQCSLLHQSDSMYSHPYFWAAFRLVGEVGPLKYAKAIEKNGGDNGYVTSISHVHAQCFLD